MSDVRLFVFNNGMQIVGDMISKDMETGKVVVQKPVQLIMVPKTPDETPTSKNAVNLGFAPFMQYTQEWDAGVPFSASDLLTVLTPARELINNYSANFGSGLILPTL